MWTLHLWFVHDILMKGIRWAWRILWKSECRFLTGMFWNLRKAFLFNIKWAPRTKVALRSGGTQYQKQDGREKETWFSDPDSGLAERGKNIIIV